MKRPCWTLWSVTATHLNGAAVLDAVVSDSHAPQWSGRVGRCGQWQPRTSMERPCWTLWSVTATYLNGAAMLDVVVVGVAADHDASGGARHELKLEPVARHRRPAKCVAQRCFRPQLERVVCVK